MKREFSDMICHHWHNLAQAQHSPTSFAHIHMEWWICGDEICSKQWYDHDGRVYRQRKHKVEDRGDVLILSTEDQPKVCIYPTNYGFHGKTPENSINSKGIEIHSEIFISKDKVEVIDIGRLNGKLLWGDVPGPFIFHK